MVLPKITRYIDQRYSSYDRWIGALKQSQLPFHVLWAKDDPVVIVDMAYKLNSLIQNWEMTVIQDCSHYPMNKKEEKWDKPCNQFY